jgi:chromosome segregation ATPase
MTILYILGAAVCVAIAIVGYLFILLQKESAEPNSKVVPVSNLQDVLKPAVLTPSTPSTLPSIELEEYKHKVEALEEELRLISDKGVAQAQEAMNMIETLTKENEQLKGEGSNKVNDFNIQFETLKQESNNLRQENGILQGQLDSAHVSLQNLQEEIVVIRREAGEEISKARAALEEFKNEKEKSAEDMQLFESLKVDNVNLRQQMEGLEIANQKLKELNATLIEQNQTLQYELTKNRAQASGLEKICENYRVQLEKHL